ncbi:hypothetical protein SAMN02745724_00969 [Pseudoalteromonas denitrificans DSM 6059]|uniref:Uncharacterized protein n=2 Tax=Pseudoalteromonas TaxID=53246 RepID=A0A1I1GTA5_9GAMM|nr:hypothetical protein SAMN02745724_00969 [Pseudoalteromonas denitrificans DSM 6059]
MNKTSTRLYKYTFIFTIFACLLLALSMQSTDSVNQPDTDTDTDTDTVLTMLNKDGLNKTKVITWLKDHWKIFSLNDPELTDAIEALCPEVFEYDFESYQNTMKMCLNNSLISNLRDLSEKNRPPFQYAGREVRIGIPADENQPPFTYAYTCFEGPLENKIINLYPINTLQPLTVQVLGAYQCNGIENYPDIQLNQHQANKLFNRKARAIEYAVALIQKQIKHY